jgi:hypothetical protein
MPDRKIHIARGEEELGTFTDEEVSELLVTGFFQPTDRYWMPDMADWLPVGEAFKPSMGASKPASRLASFRQSVTETSAGLAARLGSIVDQTKTTAAGTSRALTATKQRMLEEQLPLLQRLLKEYLKEKPLAAVRGALQNEETMRKTFGALYDCLPKPVCRFVAEDAFVRFCFEHRERLLKPASPDTSPSSEISATQPPEGESQ